MKSGMGCVVALVLMLGVAYGAVAMEPGHGGYVSNVRHGHNVSTVQEAPAPSVILQAATNAVKPDMAFDGGCTVMQGATKSATEDLNGFFPTDAVYGYFNNVRHTELDVSKARVTVLRGPNHGTLLQVSEAEAAKRGVGPGAEPLYSYRPNSGYLGPDDATLLVELDGKSYRIHTKFYVVEKINDNNFYGAGSPATLCAESQSKRVATLTFNQDINWAQRDEIFQEIATIKRKMRGQPYNLHAKCKV
ncbi:MAG TPA: hypothetical protein VFR06_08220 [Gallionellaceae bacterium]|nr:hypothetical protein [Gallionellaceae bacterium]